MTHLLTARRVSAVVAGLTIAPFAAHQEAHSRAHPGRGTPWDLDRHGQRLRRLTFTFLDLDAGLPRPRCGRRTRTPRDRRGRVGDDGQVAALRHGYRWRGHRDARSGHNLLLRGLRTLVRLRRSLGAAGQDREGHHESGEHPGRVRHGSSGGALAAGEAQEVTGMKSSTSQVPSTFTSSTCIRRVSGSFSAPSNDVTLVPPTNTVADSASASTTPAPMASKDDS
jgi:hypothetical protein